MFLLLHASKLKLVANVFPSIVYFMGNLITSYGVVLSHGKLVAHDHVFHYKKVVHAHQYPSKESFLDDDALNEHFDAENWHQQRLQSILGGQQLLEVMNVNTISSNVFSHLQNCPITINLVVDLRLVPSLFVDMGWTM
jgi:hypothetical protein